MVKKMVKYSKFVLCIALILSLVAPSYAALSASDGSAFVTKAEFDSALADFNARLTTFEAGINSKIDSQVTSYLDRNGIWNGKEQVRMFGHASTNKMYQLGAYGIVPLIAEINKSGLLYLQFHGHCLHSSSTYAGGVGQYRNLAIYQFHNYEDWVNCTYLGKMNGKKLSTSEQTDLTINASGAWSYKTADMSAYSYLQADWKPTDTSYGSTKFTHVGAPGTVTGNVVEDLILTSFDNPTNVIVTSGSGATTHKNYILGLTNPDYVDPTKPDCKTYSSYIQMCPLGYSSIAIDSVNWPIQNSQYQVAIFMFVVKGGGLFCQWGYGYEWNIANDSYVGDNVRCAGFVNSAVVY